MSDAIREIIREKKAGNPVGIPSYCTANNLVIEALLEQAKDTEEPVLIEATANQVNQFGGYTGMLPGDFIEFVYKIADKVGFPPERILFGGDHLGPLTWVSESEAEAMEKATVLVKLFVEAGYKKIHLDTSMKLGDDPAEEMLTDETIAKRGAILYKACEEAYQELLKKNPEEVRPAFIIGSEVPIPGGAQEEEESISVTTPESVEKTLRVYEEEFNKAGMARAFDNIVGVVVQPGVEFGDADIFFYDRAEAKELTDFVKGYDSIVLEGHSTDYQSKELLKEMVEDGIAILKVGPALTFALREGLFALSAMEKELVSEEKRANFPEVLEKAMLDSPKNWQKHYHGNEEELLLKRKYSFSDRCRYYLTEASVVASIEKLLHNFKEEIIPLGMLHQYMPIQYTKVRDGELSPTGDALVKDFVKELADDYRYAVRP